jgi:hypothetical protein
MDREFFQQVFCTWKGYVYRYVGDLTGIENIPVHVTERFVAQHQDNLFVSTVVEVKPGVVAVYSDTLYPDNNEFTLWFDLLTPPLPEMPPVEETPPETPPEQGQ